MKKLILSLCLGALMSVLGTSCSTEESLQNPEPINGNGVRAIVQDIPFRVLEANWTNLEGLKQPHLLIIESQSELEQYIYFDPTAVPPTTPSQPSQPPLVNFKTERVLLAYESVPYLPIVTQVRYGHALRGQEMIVDVKEGPNLASPNTMKWIVAIIVPKDNPYSYNNNVNLIVNHIPWGNI
jgi:hypothetical protein